MSKKKDMYYSNTTDLLSKGINPLSHTYQSIFDASEKKITVNVDDSSINTLKDNGYKMCFAKKIGNFNYNVVWQSYTDFLGINTFSWVPQYSVFGSNRFEDKVTVEVSCKPVNIGLGETTTLSKNGILSPAVTGGSETTITIENKYGSIHPGVNQLSIGLQGEQVATSIYVAEKAAIEGTIELTPIEKVLVWFEQDIETGTMFSTVRSKAVEVDLTFNKSCSLLYDGSWKTV